VRRTSAEVFAPRRAVRGIRRFPADQHGLAAPWGQSPLCRGLAAAEKLLRSLPRHTDAPRRYPCHRDAQCVQSLAQRPAIDADMRRQFIQADDHWSEWIGCARLFHDMKSRTLQHEPQEKHGQRGGALWMCTRNALQYSMMQRREYPPHLFPSRFRVYFRTMLAAPTWHVLRVMPQRQFEAASFLAGLGVATLLPVERQWKRCGRARRREMREYPLLRGYLPISGQMPASRRVWRSHGILGYLADANGCAAVLRGEDLERIHALLGGETVDQLAPGARVEIIGGAMAGHTGHIERAGRRQAAVVLEMLGSLRTVTVVAADLEPAT